MKKIVFALIASAAVVGAAQAQTSSDAPRSYIGIGAATANHDYSIGSLHTTGSDDWKTSAELFGGYEFNNSWGLEAGYTDFRKSGFNYTNAAGVAGSGSSDGHAIYLAAKANMQLADQVSAFGKLGVETTRRSFSTSNGLSGNDDDTGVYAGVGVQYNLSKQVALTAEYERYGTKKDYGVKPDVWTVGARYSF